MYLIARFIKKLDPSIKQINNEGQWEKITLNHWQGETKAPTAYSEAAQTRNKKKIPQIDT